MNNKIKIILLIFVIFILTGCSGNYNLNINSDLSIDENVELSIDNKGDLYQKTLDIFETNKISKDKYDVNISDDKILIEYKDSFSSIEDYILNSKVYPQLFNKIQYNKTKDYIDLYVNENIRINNNYNKSGSNLTDFDMIQINVTNPYKVRYTNAEITNDNIYTWTITKDDMSKKIQMNFKPSFNEFPIRQVIVISLIIIISSVFIISRFIRYKNTQRV